MKIVVYVDRPRDVSIKEMLNYVENAVKTECGNLSSDDPLSDLDRNKVKAVRYKKPKRIIVESPPVWGF